MSKKPTGKLKKPATKKTKSLERKKTSKVEALVDGMAASAPKINIRFLYGNCRDVAAMRTFYSDVLGMSELSFRDDDEFGWVVYDTEGLQLMFFKWDGELPIETRWAWQPGEAPEHSAPLMSFSIEYPEDELHAVVRRLREAAAPAATPGPTWRQNSYWGWTVRDPMGNTIEVFSSVGTQPPEGETPEWQD